MTPPAHGYTPSGQPITGADLEAHGVEAEGGYELDQLRPRPAGRERVTEGPSSTLTVRLTTAQRRALREAADWAGTEIGAVVRAAVDTHLAQLAAGAPKPTRLRRDGSVPGAKPAWVPRGVRAAGGGDGAPDDRGTRRDGARGAEGAGRAQGARRAAPGAEGAAPTRRARPTDAGTPTRTAGPKRRRPTG